MSPQSTNQNLKTHKRTFKSFHTYLDIIDLYKAKQVAKYVAKCPLVAKYDQLLCFTGMLNTGLLCGSSYFYS